MFLLKQFVDPSLLLHSFSCTLPETTARPAVGQEQEETATSSSTSMGGESGSSTSDESGESSTTQAGLGSLWLPSATGAVRGSWGMKRRRKRSLTLNPPGFIL